MVDETNVQQVDGNVEPGAEGNLEAEAVVEKTEAGADTEGNPESGSADNNKPEQGAEESSLLSDEAPEKATEEDEVEEAEPADYDEFTMPEGMDVDQEALSEAVPVFKELGLGQDQAQKLIDVYAQQQVKAQTEAVRQLNEQRTKWREEVKAEPEYEKSLGLAKKALKQLADPETSAMITGSWMGDHPGLVKLLANAGRAISDDAFVEGARGASRPKGPEEVLFGDMFK
jgi:hypothetical protein